MMENAKQWFQGNKKKAVAILIALITIVVLPFLKDVIFYEYEKYRNTPSKKTAKYSIPSQDNNTDEITEVEWNESNHPVVRSINQLSEMWRKSYSDLSEKYINNLDEQKQLFETYSYLEGDRPENNYSVFLESYYGINGRSKMGKLVIDSLIDQEIQWALKIQKVHTFDDPKSIFIMLKPTTPVCYQHECPDDFDDILFLHLCDCEATRDFLLETREGDFVFLEGKGRLLEHGGTDIDYRLRFSPRITKYRYRPNKL